MTSDFMPSAVLSGRQGERPKVVRRSALVDDTVGEWLEDQEGEAADLHAHVGKCAIRFAWLRARIDRSDKRMLRAMIAGCAVIIVVVLGKDKALEVAAKLAAAWLL